jgi:hypothetical protein
MVSTGKTCKAFVKHPLDGPRSYTRAHRALGHTLPTMRTSEDSTHWRAVGVVSEICYRGHRGGA